MDSALSMHLKNNRGFTLLELLIAISLSVVIFIILFAALRLGSKSQEKGLERGEVTQKVRIISDRIAWLIRGAYPFYLNRVEEQKIFFEGKSGALGFVTSSVDSYGKGPEDTAGLKWVSLYVDSEGLKLREKVYFLSDVFEDSKGKVYLLDPEIKKIEFEYFDIPEGENQGTWVSEWSPDDKDTIPQAVRVKLTMERNGKKTDLPELIVQINARRKPEG